MLEGSGRPPGRLGAPSIIFSWSQISLASVVLDSVLDVLPAGALRSGWVHSRWPGALAGRSLEREGTCGDLGRVLFRSC